MITVIMIVPGIVVIVLSVVVGLVAVDRRTGLSTGTGTGTVARAGSGAGAGSFVGRNIFSVKSGGRDQEARGEWSGWDDE